MPSLPMPRTAALAAIRRGIVIPAHPLALTARRELDERRQRALSRYYLAAGAGGLAVGVHTTQFEIRQAQHALLRPVLELAAEEAARHEERQGGHSGGGGVVVKVAGVCGQTAQAVAEAHFAAELNYDAVLLSLAALPDADNAALIDHCRHVAQVMPLVGFYLQPSVGGRILDVEFWRRFASIENVVAIKMAPFNRYRTIDVVQGVAEAGRALPLAPADPGSTADGIALYTGNDDHIVEDLLGSWTFRVAGKSVTQRIIGGLLGHWACWTQRAVWVLEQCHAANAAGSVPLPLMELARQITDMNATIFDARNDFHGCIAGVHEVLRRQGLLQGIWCLNPAEALSSGQADEITRVCAAYPHLTDDAFIAQHLDAWLK